MRNFGSTEYIKGDVVTLLGILKIYIDIHIS